MWAFLVLMCASVATAQTPSRFEVASVKISVAGPEAGFSIDAPEGTRFSTRNITVWNLIRYAHKLTDLQIAGAPDWIRNERIDIEARPASPVSSNEMLAMVQALLAERLHLKMHRESRNVPSYALQVAKDGPKLGPAAESTQGSIMRMGEMTVKRMTIAGLAQILEFELHRPVTDQTGLTGNFSFQLKWTRETVRSAPDVADSDPAKPSIFAALQEQLGLRLVTSRSPVNVQVIDNVELPTEN